MARETKGKGPLVVESAAHRHHMRTHARMHTHAAVHAHDPIRRGCVSWQDSHKHLDKCGQASIIKILSIFLIELRQ